MRNAPQGWECMVVIPHLYPRIQALSGVYCTSSITMSVYTSERHQLHTPTLLDPPPVASSKTSGASAATCNS